MTGFIGSAIRITCNGAVYGVTGGLGFAIMLGVRLSGNTRPVCGKLFHLTVASIASDLVTFEASPTPAAARPSFNASRLFDNVEPLKTC